MNRWYALKTKPHKERSVSQRLGASEVEVFFPKLRVKPKNPRSAKIRAYFPGYIFIHVDLDEQGANTFNWMPGTTGLVQFGGVPAVVPDNLIHEIRRRVEAIEAAGGLERARLSPGDRVRIVDGPFAGYDAIFDAQLPGKDRVQVLLAFLSHHPHALKLEADQIEKVN